MDPAVRELVILIVAREMDSQFEWTMHENVALEEGLAPETIEVIKYNKDVEGLQERDALLIRFGRELMRETKLSSRTFQEVLQVFGSEDLVTMTQLMGGYASTALLLRVVDQQLSPDREPLLPIGQ